MSENIFALSSGWRKFFLSQKFYAMSMGGLFAYLFARKKYWFAIHNKPSKLIQGAIIFTLLFHYLVGFSFSNALWFHFLLSVLYGMLILYTIIPGSLINLEFQPFKFLGIISYGLYMFHMLVDYFLRLLVMKSTIDFSGSFYFVPLYHLCLLGLTILVATLSYRYLESYFFRLKSRFS